MTLALDLGNSALKAACFDQTSVTASFSVSTVDPDWHRTFADWLQTLPPIESAGLASVVPQLMPRVLEAVRAAGLPAPVEVTATLPLPLRIQYQTPETLGADRIAAAVGGWLLFEPRKAVIVIDAGTALTYEAVTADGRYLGGAIAPGPRLLVDSLNRGTAQLPAVPFDVPEAPIGSDTTSALQAGIVLGFLDGVRGMLTRLRAELGHDAAVVATGGWAPWLARHVAEISEVRPLLVLEGIRDIVDAAGAAR